MSKRDDKRQKAYDALKAKQAQQLKKAERDAANKRLEQNKKTVQEAARAEALARRGVVRIIGPKYHPGEVPHKKKR